MTASKILSAAAGLGGGPTNIQDVFSTYLYAGNGSTQTITNGIDLSGEGGLVWAKQRTGSSSQHALFDTENGTLKALASSNTSALATEASVTAFNSDGFSLGNFNNTSNEDYASWTFRKAPKFFDIQTWSGTSSTQTISHDLGCTPGMIVIKCTNASSTDWMVWHKGLSNTSTKFLYLNNTDQEASYGTTAVAWGNTAPTSTEFTVGSATYNNETGKNYIAYLFAHNDGDGEFGPDEDQDIIKCGSFTRSASSTTNVNLGFEPQWILVKKYSNSSGGWYITDSMRGMPFGDTTNEAQAEISSANSANAAFDGDILQPTATGFQSLDTHQYLDGGESYIYVAIRKPPTKELESVDDFFAIDNKDTSGTYYAGWPPDFVLQKNNVDDTGTTAPWIASTRLLGDFYVRTDSNTNLSANNMRWDNMDGVGTGTSTADASDYCWMWRKYPEVFDCVSYAGNGSSTNAISHNLGVTPEMIWAKCVRDADTIWMVYHKDLTNTHSYLELNDSSGAVNTNTNVWKSVTSSNFTIGSVLDINGNTRHHIAMLFATKAGFTKVGSYTGNGSSQTIDCGFTNGAKLVMIKKHSAGGDGWLWFDSDRGIISGNSPYLFLDETSFQFSSQNYLSPDSSGFTVPSGGSEVNASGVGYIFYAIAAP